MDLLRTYFRNIRRGIRSLLLHWLPLNASRLLTATAKFKAACLVTVIVTYAKPGGGTVVALARV